MGRTRINKLQHIQKSNQLFEQRTRRSVPKPEKGKMPGGGNAITCY